MAPKSPCWSTRSRIYSTCSNPVKTTGDLTPKCLFHSCKYVILSTKVYQQILDVVKKPSVSMYHAVWWLFVDDRSQSVNKRATVQLVGTDLVGLFYAQGHTSERCRHCEGAAPPRNDCLPGNCRAAGCSNRASALAAAAAADVSVMHWTARLVRWPDPNSTGRLSLLIQSSATRYAGVTTCSNLHNLLMLPCACSQWAKTKVNLHGAQCRRETHRGWGAALRRGGAPTLPKTRL